MTSEERRTLIDKIVALPAKVEATIKGMSDTQLDTPYGEGKWTPRQVVHHLADGHINAFCRFKLILTEDHPTIKPYNQDLWAKLPDTVSAPVEPSLQIIRGVHDRWSRLLRSIPESNWSRSAHHSERGEVTLDALLTIYAGHGEKHVGQIMALRTRQGW